ncbi:Na+/H+ antiporter subunit A [Streptomyces sp. NBC_00237]|uniref:Na+/H+ antiporter subunit A n=1 Tax=Streptomyces sp. NBC_00237 TaxID=2975687 RepID=UPI00224F5954|nr:Na+/H+ antiporter subunit A [Streptomyces sp. NBC_00237]MCX5200224.1 Na+/H+ antiporter subunit A [Streptomyces sp. NBC_00237]
MTFLVLGHFVLALCAAPLVRRRGPRAFVVLAVPPVVALGWALAQWDRVVAGRPTDEAWTWIEDYGVEVAFRLDALAMLMVLLAAGIGALVLLYCVSYFDVGEPRLGPFAGQLLGFAGAMLGLVLADDLLVLYLFWELTTVLSFLLIGYDCEKRAGRRSALQALLVTSTGGLAMFVGFLMIGEAAGTYRISRIIEEPPPASTALSTAVVLVLCGAIAKSAIWPLSVWLPNAMAAPTPVSAYLHAAAMVKAGVYLVARLAPAFADVPPWRPVLLTLGTVTMLLGGWRALRQHDLKLVLAYGTVSQLGFLVVLAGVGTYDAALAASAMILGHALFKAPLFLVTGIVDHAAGTRDLRELSGVGRALPRVCATAVVAGASMAALPPLLGFVAKEAAFEALLNGTPGERWVLAFIVVGSALTVAYTVRFLWGAFARKPGRADTHVHRVGAAFLAPPALLAVACLVLGPAVAWPAGLFERYAAQYPVPEHPYHLALWHGFGPALGLSALAWVLGAALFVLRGPVAALGARLAWPSAERAFDGTVLGVERGALQLTGYVQKGSLPAYVATVLSVVVCGLLAVFVVDRPWQEGPPAPRPWDSPWQAVVAALTCACALLCLTVQRRMQAAVLAGLTGYGTALLYVVHGAPDLALTQFGVETVSTVVLVLVLRRLPLFFGDGDARKRYRRVWGLVLALFSSVVAAVAVWLAAGARQGTPIGAAMVGATAEHGLKDVVATILVDFRAWDTLGESAVLVAAVAGVTSLLFTDSGQEDPEAPGAWRASSRVSREERAAQVREHAEHDPSPYDLAAPERDWLAAGGATDPRHRSVVFEVIARLIFHPILMLSAYLLFCAENLPGGGFVGGLVAGIALTIRYLAGGRYELEAATGFHAGFFVGLGLAVSTTVALAGLLGGTVLRSWSWHGHLPLVGDWHVGTSVFFDIGVYLLVTGVVLDTVRALGAWMDQGAEDAALAAETAETAETAEAPAPDSAGTRTLTPEANQ